MQIIENSTEKTHVRISDARTKCSITKLNVKYLRQFAAFCSNKEYKKSNWNLFVSS